jgi:competence protein ComEC
VMETRHAAAVNYRVIGELLFNRVILVITQAYILGITAGKLWQSSSYGVYLLVTIVLLIAFTSARFSFIDYFKAVFILAAFTAGGAAFIFAQQPPAGGVLNYTGEPVYVEGTVVDEPIIYSDNVSYRLKVHSVETAEGKYLVPGSLLVRIYGDSAETYWFGEKLRVRGVIVEPSGLRNPGGFDYRYHLKSQGIDALIYPKASMVESLGTGELAKPVEAALRLRASLVKVIESNLPSPSDTLLTAILFGQRQRLPEQVADNFRRAGAGHLMAVSGLHVGLVAGLFLGLCRLCRLQGRAPLAIAVALVLAYAYMTGLRPSAVRAALMVSLAFGASILDRENDLPSAVAFAALTTLFFNPLLLFTVGFQLSYAATISLIYAYKPLVELPVFQRCPLLLRAPIAVTLAAQIGVLPLSIYYFHALPTTALVFNLCLIPLITFTVGLGLAGALTALVIPLAGELLIWASRPLLELMILITSYSNQPFMYITVRPPGTLTIFMIYGIMSVILLIYYLRPDNPEGGKASLLLSIKPLFLSVSAARGKARVWFLITLLFIFTVISWASLITSGSEKLIVTFIDVGQGASALIETPCGTVILVDAGGEPSYRGDPGAVGERIILPFLNYKGIRSIDMAIITHPHEDHFGGFIPLVERLQVKHLLVSPIQGGSDYYEDLLEKVISEGTVIQPVGAGQTWLCKSGTMLEIIAPPQTLHIGTNSDFNNNSVVFILRYEEVNMLFTGDIEDIAVKDMLKNNSDLRSNLLLIPHHGGYLETMPALLEAVEPDVAVIQVGNNSFGHPHPYTISVLESTGTAIYRNDHHGAIIAETDGRVLNIYVTERDYAVAVGQ